MWVSLSEMERLSSPSVWSTSDFDRIDFSMQSCRQPVRTSPPPIPLHRDGASLQDLEKKSLPKQSSKRRTLWKRLLVFKRRIVNMMS